MGPVLQLIALNGAPLKKPAGVYALGLKNIGLIKAAFDFGSTPPLDGGGIFEFGLQYGGGIKYQGITESNVSSRLSRDLEQDQEHHRQQL